MVDGLAYKSNGKNELERQEYIEMLLVRWFAVGTKKHPHPSANEECRCLYNEAINYLAIINCFLFPSAFCGGTC
jgi:hypothetical protein